VAAEQVVLITGCSSGIGRATALEAARRGHRVFATARNPGDLADLERRGNLVVLALDVTDAASIRAAVEAVLAHSVRIDDLVNNAGYGQYGAVEEITPEQWRAQFDVNFFGAIDVSRAVLPTMRQARRGAIVMMSSVAGKLPIPFASPDCATKHALEAVSDALRVEVSPFGVRVILVEPGPIETRFGDRARSEVGPLLTRPGPYRDLYTGAERAMDVDFQRGKLPADAVARVVVDAIEAKRPRTRYPVGAMAKVLVPLKGLLPDRWLDFMMKRSLKIPPAP
jgi:NAD(P)-dependent dehydrogenase (short-subunit alcohol dehydrogenase family)